MKRLRSLGYAGGTQPVPRRDGVTVHDPQAGTEGVNLLCDGHAAWAGLIDMSGRELHSWSFAFEKAFPDSDIEAPGTGYYRRVALGEDGSLLAIFEGLGLIKIDRDSRLLWRYSGRAHHDLEVQEDGRIFVLTREAEVLRRIHKKKPVLHDFVAVLDPDGRELDRVSILEALESSPYASLIEISAKQGDLFHTNTVEVLDGRFSDRLQSLRRGNVLLSLREVNAVVILDMERRKVVWAMAGLFKAQHQPTLLDNGHLLVFDNRGLGRRSRVLEVDPLTRDIAWVYDAPDFYSQTCGSNQRLPNGHTLITESDGGRAFEVTPEGRIVWEYVSPHRFGHQDRKIATVLRGGAPAVGLSARLVALRRAAEDLPRRI